MGIWVVVLEAVAGHDRTTIRPDDLDALANALVPNYEIGRASCRERVSDIV
jgi:hypothetical protein